MARKITVSKFSVSLLGTVTARNPVSLSVQFYVKTESIVIEFTSLIVAVFERISVEYT